MPRSSFHRRIAYWTGKSIGLEGLEEGSLYPDQIAMGKRKKEPADDYGVNWKFPHHKRSLSKIRNLIESLRKEKLDNGKANPFFLGALTHLIADKWCPDSRASNFKKFENRLDKIRFDSDFRTSPEKGSKVLDAEILNKIPNRYPFQKYFSEKPSLEEAAKNAYKESLTAVKSIDADCSPREEYWNSYKRAERSIKKHKTLRKLYWLLNLLHPLGWLTAIVQHEAIQEDDTVLRYTKAKKQIGSNMLIGAFGLTFSLFFPILLFCALPILGQFLFYKIEIDDSLRRNVDWYDWNIQRNGDNQKASDICPECDAKLEPDSKYCIECGAKLDVEENEEGDGAGRESVKKTEEICPVCGAKLEPDAEFCVECGTDITGGEIEMKPDEEIVREKPRKTYNCVTCGKQISKKEYEKNEGQCDNCVIEDSGIAMIYK